MRERSIEALKESQIKSWWSTYQQKRKREICKKADMQNTVRNVAGNAALTSTSPTGTPTLAVTVGKHCQVHDISGEYDIFSSNPQGQLKTVVLSILQEKPSYHISVGHGKPVIVITDCAGSVSANIWCKHISLQSFYYKLFVVTNLFQQS